MNEHFECKSPDESRIGGNGKGSSQAQKPGAFGSLRSWMLLALSLTVPCVFANFAFGQTTLVVYGTTDIFNSSACYSFPAAAGQSVTFSSVTGLAGFGGPVGGIYSTSGDGADPSLAQTTGVNLPAQGVFSGLENNPGLVFFLTGVFVGPSASRPPTINFSGHTNFRQFSPQVNQLFFIGDGLTGTGSGRQQIFHVPASATGLCLGFGDGAFFSGAPTFSDNWGSLTVVFNISTCPIIVVKNPQDPTPEYMTATMAAADPSNTVSDVASSCGFDSFNWQQQITNDPGGSSIRPNRPDLLNPQNISPIDGSLVAPPSYYDPPKGSYTYLEWDSYPFVYDSSFFTPGGTCTLPGTFQCPLLLPYIVSSDGKKLSFADGPVHRNLSGLPAAAIQPSGTKFLAFSTALVGVSDDLSGNKIATPLSSWTWNTTFNGTAGGVFEQSVSRYPIDPGSGTGGVTITSVNGVVLTAIPASQIAITASGLAYSRANQTFNGTINITNISGVSISAPVNGFFEILLTSLPSGVTLANSEGLFMGSPFLTVPETTTLGPGQSVGVNVRLLNPTNAKINFTPVLYSGRF